MKRLFGLLLVFVVFFSFSAKSAFGQATSGTETYDYFKGIIDSHHTETYTTLAGFVSSGGVAAQAAGDYRTFIGKAKEAYDTAFSQARESGTKPVEAQLLGIRAWLTSTQDPANFTPVRRYGISSPSNTVYSQLSRKMSDASLSAERIKRGNIEAGSGEDTVATGGGTIATAGTTNKNETVIVNERKCSAGFVSCFISESVQWIIKNTLMQIAGFLLWLTSNMFSHVIQVGILEFKNWASDALFPLWALVRQIVSLGVVFVGLYLGFMYILGRADTFARYIPWLLMFALFVNFSYPVARFAVDISNIVSLNIYAAAFSNEALNSTSNASAGAVIMNRLGLSSLVMGATYVEGSAGANIIKDINTLPAALLVVVFILYAAYVFFMATAILVMRTAALVFLIIASPFLFIDSVLPVLGDKAQQIRKIFFEQLAVGPVFMLLIALTTKFMLVFSEGPLKAYANSSLEVNGGGVGVFFNILMMIVMLHITLKITKHVSGSIGQMATDAMGKVGGFAMGAAGGGAGLLARNSLGRLAAKARDSKWVTNNQDSLVGRRVYDMSNSLAKSSYDLRNSSVIAGGMKRAGLGMGQGRTAGYEEAMEKRKQDILDRGSRIKTRYERTVTDKDGNIIHRQGDIDKEADAAYDRYIAQGGGSVFMSQEQKQLAKEALGKQAGERSDKDIAEAKKNAEREVSLYNGAEDTVDPRTGKLTTKKENQKNFVAELHKELEQLKETGVDLQRDSQAQSIILALNTIEQNRGREAATKSKEIEDLLEKYSRIQGTGPAAEQSREKFRLDMSKENYELFMAAQSRGGGSTILGTDGRPIKGVAQAPAALDIDLNQAPQTKVADTNWDNYELPPSMRGTSTSSVNPNDVAAARVTKQQEAAARANAEMDKNTRPTSASAVDIPLDIPEVHNPATDDVAAMAAQLALSNMKKGPPPYGSTSTSSSTLPRNPAPSSGGASAASDKNRQEIMGAFAEARGKPSEIARIAKEAEKMGFDSDSISRMRDEGVTA